MRLAPLLLIAPLALGGCAATAALGSAQPSSIAGTAAGLFGIPAATVASQLSAEVNQIAAVAMQLQMLKAQLDGVPMPVLPAMGGTMVGTTVPVVPSGSVTTGTVTGTPVVMTPSPIPAPVPMPTVP